ncbi:MAG: D-hexose-6-phosphate mutarotase [Burkholderiales bacterium PBB4]|nr:MAG: D-hexose-6-phosphate mutarotase [Burkholderiales bacterium PBB4]
MQHGPVRNMDWQLVAAHEAVDGALEVRLTLQRAHPAGAALNSFAPHLDLQLEVRLSDVLQMRLQTQNQGAEPFVLTQALHSYFAVGDVMQSRLEGVDGMRYDSRLDGCAGKLQVGAFVLNDACDNTYAHECTTPPMDRHYRLVDTAWSRQISLVVSGSEALVVWNPGAGGAVSMADVPDTAWRDFLCVEAANAGPDVVVVPPGGGHALCQTLRCTALEPKA